MSAEDTPVNGVAPPATNSESASSPRVSSIASGTEGKPRHVGPTGIVDPGAPGMDTHHWAGVRRGPRGDVDSRSVASSMAAEKDALSVNEQQDELEGELKMQPGEGEMLDRDGDQEGLNGLADEPSAMEVGPDVLGAGISIASLKSALPGASNATDVGSSVAGTLSPRGSEIARHISIGGMSYDAGAAEDSLPVSPPMSPLPPPSVEGADAGEGKAGEGAAPEADAAPWAEGQGADSATGEDQALEEVALPGDEAPLAEEPSSPADQPPPAEEESSALTAETATNPDATVRLKPALVDALDNEGSTSEIADQSKAMQSLTGGGADAGPAPAPPSPGQEESDLVVHGDAAGSAGAPKTAVAPLETTAPRAPVPLPDEFAPAWEETFRGLVHADGVDTLGRPVVVLDADAVPRNMKSSAARYVTTHLAGLVERGPYVLVLTARRAALPGMWVMGAYTTLPRPFRKNVKRIVLVRPTPFLRAMLTLLRPLMSAKAARKITQADSLRDVARATEGEVQLDSLGPSFLEHAREELRETAPEEQGDPAP